MRTDWSREIGLIRLEVHRHKTWLTHQIPASANDTGQYVMNAIRAADCLQILPHAHARQVCTRCLGLLEYAHPFRNALARIRKRGGKHAPTGSRSRGKEDRSKVLDQLRETRRALRFARRAQVRAESRQIASSTVPLPTRSPPCQVNHCLAVGDITGAAVQLTRIGSPQCDADFSITSTSEELTTTAASVAAQIIRQQRSYRTATNVKDFLAALRILGGAKVYNYVALNLNLPSERSARRWRPELPPFGVGASPQNFALAAAVYGQAMRQHAIEGPVPCMLTEDETAINATLDWDPATDSVIGSCGTCCSGGCVTKKECQGPGGRGCVDPHGCLYRTENVALVLGDDGETYANLKTFVKKHKKARLLRVILVNPLHRLLPCIPIVLVGTCLTFSYGGYLLKQWEYVEELFETALNPIGLHWIGHSSDGDQRRRRAFMIHSTSTAGIRFTLPGAEGFTHTGRVVGMDGGGTRVRLNMDQDYKHNIKKLINCLTSSTRHLKIGPNKHANLDLLRVLVTDVPRARHGILTGDLDRHGSRAMDVPSALRLISTDALAAIRIAAETGYEGVPRQPFLAGLHRLLTITHLYATIFMQNQLSHLERVEQAGTVVTYLRLWREWVKNRDRGPDPEYAPSRTKRMDDYITRECSQDVLLSCHFVVLLIRTFREYYPDLECPFERCGSDSCETFFSSLGSFVMNKRVYSVCEALQTTRSQVVLKLLGCSGRVQYPKSARGGEKWQEPKGCAHNPLNWPSDEAMATSWNAGVQIAYRWATADNMKPKCTNPRAQQRNRRYPEWWSRPHLFDARAPAPGREEDHYEEDDGEEDVASADVNDDTEGSQSDTEDSDDDEDGDNAPLAALRAVGGVVPGENINMYMSVPGVGRRHKAAVLRDLAGPGFTVSTDRAVRVRQTAREQQRDFSPATSKWVMAIGTDIAIRYEMGNNICMARVISMRKRINKKWVRYNRPVVLEEDRRTLGDLYVTCHYYKRVQGSARGRGRTAPKIFAFNISNSDENHVTMVVCPVKLDYDETTRLYTLDKECDAVISAALRGQTEWDPE